MPASSPRPLRFSGDRTWRIRATQARQAVLGLLIAGGLLACAPPLPDATIPTASPAPAAIFLPRCAASVRTQQDLDLAGLPPLVPSRAVVRCLLHAEPPGSAYDAGYSAAIELTDGRQLRLYERRGGLPDKAGPTQTVREGVRDVAGTSWSWTVLENGLTILTAMTQGPMSSSVWLAMNHRWTRSPPSRPPCVRSNLCRGRLLGRSANRSTWALGRA